MKRLIDHYLLDWINQKTFKPVLLRGARQVGKTYSVRQLASYFDSFIELNLEFTPAIRNLFIKDLDPQRIVRDIELLQGKKVIPGKTLLFFDEVQAEPQAVQSLRYFYELMPQLHVIAAGSLLDFTIEHIGLPVGRVQSLYMYPMSFVEFLLALEETVLLDAVLHHDSTVPISTVAHERLTTLVGEYLGIGGMPEVVKAWVTDHDPQQCFALQQTLTQSYRQDFGKYSKKYQIKYLDILFDTIPLQLGKKFKYSLIDGNYRKRELAPCLDLLSTAGVVNKVIRTHAQGIPLGAQADPSLFKVIFLDVGLAQSVLGLDLKDWFLHPEQQLVNKGEIVEAFVGQEMLAYADPIKKQQLYYWQRMERGSQAEIDYVAVINQDIVPIEVKSGSGSTLKSMHLFLEHTQSKYGIRFSSQNYSLYDKVHSYPLYAVAQALHRIPTY